MSLANLQDGWMKFGQGRIWRCTGPAWLVEVDRKGHVPAYNHLQQSVNKIRKIRSFYSGKISFGNLDGHGTGLDILTANAMAESLGSVPSSLEYSELKNVYDNLSQTAVADRLREMIDYIATKEKYLVRKEPGYINPINTPGRISVGSHHVLLSTALGLLGKSQASVSEKNEILTDLVLQLPSVSKYAGELAVKYFQNSFSKHQLHPPLMAAIYNAGSLRPDSANAWDLKQYGNHLDRWIAFYNTSRMLVQQTTGITTVQSSSRKVLEVKVKRKIFTNRTTIGEMFINEQFHCYTLEDVIRTKGVKVYGETAIQPGRYKLAVTFSQRFQKMMPQIMDVPMFEGIRIHAGNTEKDTLGCILVGSTKGENRISNCKGVYDSLLQRLMTFEDKEQMFIDIINEGAPT